MEFTSVYLNVLREFAETIRPSKRLNERYLHHALSARLQRDIECGTLMDADDAVQFHPEWPTFKKATNLPFRRYKNVVFPDGKKAYMPIEDDSVLGRGTAGFIDFVFGNYESPHTALELSLKFGWAHEEIVDDFLKIIDSRNPFKVGFSFNVVIRNALVSRGLNNLELHIQDALEEAKHRLDGVWCGSEREIHLLVSEISETGRRHWHYRPEAGFVRGIW